jgi:hypothetical protein
MIAARFHQDTLTHIELIWHERQIEHWIRFGRDVAEKILDRRRRILSFAPNSIVAYVRWLSGDFGTIVSRIASSARSGGAKLSLAFPMCALAVKSPCESQAGRRSSGCCRRSMPSNTSASTRQSLVPITGGMFITAWPQAKHRGRTAASSIGHGWCARRSTHDMSRDDHDNRPGGGLRGDDIANPSCPEADLECQRQMPIGLYAARLLVTLSLSGHRKRSQLSSKRAAIWRETSRS